MNTKKTLIIIAILGFWISTINAQTDTSWRNGVPVTREFHHNWSVGAGFNIVDDSGKTLGGIIEPSRYWNFSVPFYISTEYFLNNKFSFGAMLSTNKYKEGKQIDNGILFGDEPLYFAADLTAKYYFRDLLQTYVFDPYVFLGFGYTGIGAYTTDPIDYQEKEVRHIPASNRLTVNFGLGFNVWFYQKWAVNLNWAGKWGIDSGEATHGQKQYTFGIIYLIN